MSDFKERLEKFCKRATKVEELDELLNNIYSSNVDHNKSPELKEYEEIILKRKAELNNKSLNETSVEANKDNYEFKQEEKLEQPSITNPQGTQETNAGMPEGSEDTIVNNNTVGNYSNTGTAFTDNTYVNTPPVSSPKVSQDEEFKVQEEEIDLPKRIDTNEIVPQNKKVDNHMSLEELNTPEYINKLTLIENKMFSSITISIEEKELIENFFSTCIKTDETLIPIDLYNIYNTYLQYLVDAKIKNDEEGLKDEIYPNEEIRSIFENKVNELAQKNKLEKTDARKLELLNQETRANGFVQIFFIVLSILIVVAFAVYFVLVKKNV